MSKHIKPIAAYALAITCTAAVIYTMVLFGINHTMYK
jgi:hypothetical protein